MSSIHDNQELIFTNFLTFKCCAVLNEWSCEVSGLVSLFKLHLSWPTWYFGFMKFKAEVVIVIQELFLFNG